MLKEIIGTKGMVFHRIYSAQKDEEGYVELSFQNIADHIDGLSVDAVRRAIKNLISTRAIERVSRGAPFKNKWRVSPEARSNLKEIIIKNNKENNDE